MICGAGGAGGSSRLSCRHGGGKGWADISYACDIELNFRACTTGSCV